MHKTAPFLQGSIFKHVITMSTTNAIGLFAIFLVDLVDIYFISLLNNSALTAAIGYASAILFFTSAICIGLSIANSALVAQALGQQRPQLARQYVSHLTLFAFLISMFTCLLLFIFSEQLLIALGAQGHVLVAANAYLRILLLSMPLFALTMQMSATLRALNGARDAMSVTLLVALLNALLDPLFIFVFDLDLVGAAYASWIARLLGLLLAVRYVFSKYRMLSLPKINDFYIDAKKIANIALPAMLTQLATPIGNLFVTYMVAQFGAGYIAGWAIIGRLIPVAFGLMFAISGAISPIISQNYGAGNITRLWQILNEALKLIGGYCLVISLLLSFGQEWLITLFNAQHEAAQVMRIFCQHIAISFIFTGITLVAMAFLNNLGYAKYATLLNIGKVTLGTMPFVALGAMHYGAAGILYGQALGNTVSAFVALILVHVIMRRTQRQLDTENVHQTSSS